MDHEVITEEIVKDKTFYLVLLVILAVVMMGCIFILVKSYLRLMNRNRTLHESIENLGKLNDKLRMDRHDYLNHLQIVYGPYGT